MEGDKLRLGEDRVNRNYEDPCKHYQKAHILKNSIQGKKLDEIVLRDQRSC